MRHVDSIWNMAEGQEDGVRHVREPPVALEPPEIKVIGCMMHLTVLAIIFCTSDKVGGMRAAPDILMYNVKSAIPSTGL